MMLQSVSNVSNVSASFLVNDTEVPDHIVSWKGLLTLPLVCLPGDLNLNFVVGITDVFVRFREVPLIT
jgi:hypothetical protein